MVWNGEDGCCRTSVKAAGLPERFVEDDTGGSGEVEAPDRTEDGDTDAGVPVGLKEFLRESRGFPAEDKKVSLLEGE
jgi:hypothetical protein